MICLYFKNIHYVKIGDGLKSVIFLHGWGGSYKSFYHLKDYISSDLSLYFIDIPGFGKSKLNYAYHLLDYSNLIEELIIKLNIKDALLVGHSFGGRIILKMLENKPYKTILISTPGFYKKTAKTRIKLFLKKYFNLSFPSNDYKSSSPLLRMVMNNILKDTTYINIEKLKEKPLIIHGRKDKVVKIGMARKLKRKTGGSLIITQAGHFPQNDDPALIAKVIESYVNS